MDKELTVLCPACGAIPGDDCVNLKSGGKLVGHHAERTAKVGGALPTGKKSRPERYGITKTVQYKAADGSLHDTWQAAVEHTNRAAFENWLREWLEERVGHRGELNDSTEKVARALAADLRVAWNIYRRKL